MSNYKDCAIYVDGNGNYCCARKEICVEKGCAFAIHVANADGIPYYSLPTGDPTDGMVEAGVLNAGVNLIYIAGEYIIEHPECEALDGTAAPEDVAEHITICCTKMEVPGDFMQFQKLCELLTAVEGLPSDPIDLQPLVDKLCKLLEVNGPIEAKLCDILLAVATEGGDTTVGVLLSLLDIFTDTGPGSFCDKLNQIIANTSAITGIETSLGQVGCTLDDEGNVTGSVLVCKVSDTVTGEDTIKVWHFATDGTVTEDYEGEYEGCTSLARLEQVLVEMWKCLIQIKEKITWQVQNGYDTATCKPVWWVQGINAEGEAVFPNEANCPVYYDGIISTKPDTNCNCLQTCFAKSIKGINVTLNVPAAVVTTTNGVHEIKIAVGAGTLSNQLIAELDSAVASNSRAICTLSVGGVAFTYSHATIQGSNGSYTSTLPVAANNCEQDIIDNEWTKHLVGETGESNGYGVTCCAANATNCVTEAADCTVPMDPQPEFVALGPVPATDKKVLEAVQKVCTKLDTLIENDSKIIELYSCSELSGQLHNREWDLGPRPSSLIDTAGGQAIRLQGIPTGTPTVDTDWGSLFTNDTNNATDVQDIQVIEGFLKVTQGFWMRYTTGSAGYIAVELGECCGPMEVVIEGSRVDGTQQPTNAVYIPVGAHSIRIWNIDDWTNTSHTLQISNDGITFGTPRDTIPGLTLGRVKPVETKKLACLFTHTGILKDALTGEVIDKANCTVDPLLCSVDASAQGIDEIIEKMCAPCKIMLTGAVQDEETGIIKGTSDEDTTSLNGTTQTVCDQWGNEIGTGVIDSEYDGESGTSTVSVTPSKGAIKEVTVGTIGTVIQIGTVLTPRTAVKGEG